MKKSPIGFVPEPLRLEVDLILPSRTLPAGLIQSKKFKQIKASIEDVGLIEPFIVREGDKRLRQYILLDGHIRLMALKQLGWPNVLCLVATDDESYTYNNRINRLSSIQEHLMIRRAIEKGVKPERLAKALNVDTRSIIRKNKLLEGICSEAIELLKDQEFSTSVGAALRKMKPIRQVESVELMLATNNFTSTFAKALLVSTPANMLVDQNKPKKLGGVSADQMGKMEREMGSLQSQFKVVEQSYGQNVLNLVLAKGYLTKLLDNKAVVKFLTQNQPDVLSEFEKVVKTDSLEN